MKKLYAVVNAWGERRVLGVYESREAAEAQRQFGQSVAALSKAAAEAFVRDGKAAFDTFFMLSMDNGGLPVIGGAEDARILGMRK